MDAAARARRAWQGLRARPVAFVVVASIVFKVAVLAASWALLRRPDDYLRDLSTAWDGANYLGVAREGYGSAGVVTAAYHWPPLFPLLVRAVGAGDMAPFWINNLAAAAAVAVVVRTMGMRAGLFFALYPTWVAFSSFGYTEGLFVLLAASALLLWRRRAHAALAGTAAAAAILARYAGLFPFLTFGVWALWTDRRRALLFALPVAAAGVVLLGWHWWGAGTPLAYVEASRPWGRTFGWPWEQVEWAYHGWFTNQAVVREPHHFWLLRNAAFMVPSFFGFMLLLRSDRLLAAFCAGTVLLTLFAAETQILGIPRYLLAAFPAIAVLGDRIRDRVGWVAYAAAAAVGSCWVVTGQMAGFVS